MAALVLSACTQELVSEIPLPRYKVPVASIESGVWREVDGVIWRNTRLSLEWQYPAGPLWLNGEYPETPVIDAIYAFQDAWEKFETGIEPRPYCLREVTDNDELTKIEAAAHDRDFVRVYEDEDTDYKQYVRPDGEHWYEQRFNIWTWRSNGWRIDNSNGKPPVILERFWPRDFTDVGVPSYTEIWKDLWYKRAEELKKAESDIKKMMEALEQSAVWELKVYKGEAEVINPLHTTWERMRKFIDYEPLTNGYQPFPEYPGALPNFFLSGKVYVEAGVNTRKAIMSHGPLYEYYMGPVLEGSNYYDEAAIYNEYGN
jgi:hypothetical protein